MYRCWGLGSGHVTGIDGRVAGASESKLGCDWCYILVNKKELTALPQVYLLAVEMPNPVLGSTVPYSGGAFDARWGKRFISWSCSSFEPGGCISVGELEITEESLDPFVCARLSGPPAESTG